MLKFFKLAGLIILYISCLRTTISAGPVPNPDKIIWDANYRLSFDDFRGKGGNDTLIYKNDLGFKELGKITKAIIVNSSSNSDGAIFIINAVMDRNKSWIRYADDTACLKHEQGHFDICEIYARLLRKMIKEAESISEAKDIYYRVINDEEAEQKLYDNDNSGIPEGINSAWEEKIQHRLTELETYANPEVNVSFKTKKT